MHVVALTAAQLAALERTIPQRVPGGELELGDAAVSAFEVDCLAVPGGYELVCDRDGFDALVAFVADPAVRAQGGLDEELDEAIDVIMDVAGGSEI